MLIWAEQPDYNSFLPGGFDDDCLKPTAATVHRLSLKTAVRQLVIDSFLIDTQPDYLAAVMKAKRVPQDAERINDYRPGDIRMRWRAIDVDEATYELLFDMERFEALDENGPDPETFERRSAGIWDV